jgi:hypothetical protein
VLAFGALVFERPAEVRDAEADRAPNGGELMVIHEDDAAVSEQPAGVAEVEEDALEAVIPVDEREVEAPAFGEQPRQDHLGRLGVELDQLTHACLLEGAKAGVDVAVRQPRVDRHVSSLRAIREQALADEERRDRVAETGLDRSPGAFPANPFAQPGALLGADRDRREVVPGQALAYFP